MEVHFSLCAATVSGQNQFYPKEKLCSFSDQESIKYCQQTSLSNSTLHVYDIPCSPPPPHPLPPPATLTQRPPTPSLLVELYVGRKSVDVVTNSTQTTPTH